MIVLQTLQRANRFVGAHLPWFVLACVTLGVAFPDTFAPLKHITMGLFAFMTFANSLGGGFRELRQAFSRPLPVLTALVLLHVVMPLAALGLGTLLFPDAPLFTTGLVLEYTVPCGVSCLMWVGMGGGNMPLCLSIVLLDTLLSPLVIPASLRVLVGSAVTLDTWGMMTDLLIMVAIPAVLAMTLYQTTQGRVAATWKPTLAPFAKLALLVIITANASGCAPFLRDLDRTLVLVMAVTFLLCLLGFFLGYWAGKLQKRDFPTLETMAVTGGMRNISAGAVLAAQYFPPEVLFPVAFSPIFLQVTTSLIVKILQHTKPGKAHAEALRAEGETVA